MSDLGNSWPEQEAAEVWWRTHRQELKEAVTATRLELQRQLAAALARLKEEEQAADSFLSALVEKLNAALPPHPDPQIMRHRRTTSPAEVLVSIESCGSYIRGLNAALAAAQERLGEVERERDEWKAKVTGADDDDRKLEQLFDEMAQMEGVVAEVERWRKYLAAAVVFRRQRDALKEQLAEVEGQLGDAKRLLDAALRRVDVTVAEKYREENVALQVKLAEVEKQLENARNELQSLR